MGTSDGTVLGTTKVLDNGADDEQMVSADRRRRLHRDRAERVSDGGR